MILELGELNRHRRVAPSQPLDRHVLRLVVSKTKVPISAEEGLLRLLQVASSLPAAGIAGPRCPQTGQLIR